MYDDRETLALMAIKTDFISFAKSAFRTVYPKEKFSHAEFMDAIAYTLKRVDKGKETRLIYNLPPRNLKTFLITVCYTAWRIGHSPSTRIIIATYGDELSQKFMRDIRQIMDAPWYKAIFPETIISQRKNSSSEIETTQKGFIFVTSTGSTLTGRGANVIIIDDPMKAADAFSESHRKRVIDWFHNTLYTRLDSKEKSALIVVMQRLHEDDLSGHLEETGSFRKVAFSAIAMKDEKFKTAPGLYYKRCKGDILNPLHESRKSLEKTRKFLGSHAFSAQYQQEAIPFDGTIFKRKSFNYYDNLPTHIEKFRIVVSWDTANTANDNSDYTVGSVWFLSDQGFFLEEVIVVKEEFQGILSIIDKYRYKYPTSELIVEPAGNGHAIIQLCQRERIKVWYSSPTEDKITRALRQIVLFEKGMVLFKKDAPWLAHLEKELLSFPNGKNDDQVDSITQALEFAERFFMPHSNDPKKLI